MALSNYRNVGYKSDNICIISFCIFFIIMVILMTISFVQSDMKQEDKIGYIGAGVVMVIGALFIIYYSTTQLINAEGVPSDVPSKYDEIVEDLIIENAVDYSSKLEKTWSNIPGKCPRCESPLNTDNIIWIDYHTIKCPNCGYEFNIETSNED